MSDLSVAVLGLGEAGFELHLPALHGLRGVRVAGACDSDPARRQRASRRFGVPVFDDFEHMLSVARPDVVVVGTPPAQHADHVTRALAAGTHVICEKPFACSVAEAEGLIEAAARAGRGLAVNHQFRHMPIFRALRGAAEAERPLFAQVWQLMNLPPWDEAGWRGAIRRRVLFDAGVHLVDLLLGVFRERPRAVIASLSSGGTPHSHDAVVLATIEFADGRLAHIAQSRLSAGPRRYFEARIDTATSSVRASFGGRASLHAGLEGGTRPYLRIDFGASGLAWIERGTHRSVIARNPRSPMVMATREVFAGSLAAFRDGGSPPTSGLDACLALRVVAGCYRSAELGRRIVLDESAAELANVRMGVPDEP